MYPKLIENTIAQLSKLPGVGRRSAERMVFWILNQPKEEARQMAESITQLREHLTFCRNCNNFSEDDLCNICKNSSRDPSIICVVETPKDVSAIEKTATYKGLYHVLLGTICPSEGRGPEHLKVEQLLRRLQSGTVQEVVIATDADNEGEMTALYLLKQLRPLGLKITRIGFGIPVGSSVEYTDLSTLALSLSTRREI
ncbi:MAG: recombination protein RecR [Candidatus Omnitrophica bacterium CG12_big_fil_rev_8_21_14_0_65_50_5]|nr:MAG: recombination protein RecR [Candidatus Omnitrophica bacterium CG12_big_fil_rev_8_21_14_0_65_50_5]